MLRFAPSPTGDMHIGNLRAAIFNYILSLQRKEPFLIRIEDTDKARNIDGKDKEILDLLETFGLTWDKLVYQSDNFPKHREIALDLIAQGRAFYCYCTKEFLEEKKQEAIQTKRAFRYDDSWAESCKASNPNPSIRLKGSSHAISFIDEIKGECRFEANEIDSFVIMREDSIPTYNFACSIDDMLYDISYIVRGEDHTSNTPKQILIKQYLNDTHTLQYAHLPIILNNEGKKMSKRENESSVKWLLSEGYLPEAIINYLLFMGNKTPKEIFTLQEAVGFFDIKKLSKSPVRFDINQLRYINREHLTAISPIKLANLLESNNENLGNLAKVYLEESSTLREIKQKLNLIFGDIPSKCSSSVEFAPQIQQIATIIDGLFESSDEALDTFDALKTKISASSGLKGKELFHPLRILLTGAKNGPLLNELYPFLKPFLVDIIRR